jgi:hypothetical protein
VLRIGYIQYQTLNTLKLILLYQLPSEDCVWLQHKETSVAVHQTNQEPLLLNSIVAYSTKSRVGIYLVHSYMLILKPVDFVIVNKQQLFTLVV